MPTCECLSNQVAAGVRHINSGFEMHRGNAVAKAHRPSVVRGHGNTIRVRSNAKRKESRRILSKSNDRRVSASRDWHDQLAHDRLVSLMRKLEPNIKRGFASDRRSGITG